MAFRHYNSVARRINMSQSPIPQGRITLRIPQAMLDRAKEKAEAEYISLNSYIVRAIERALAQKGR